MREKFTLKDNIVNDALIALSQSEGDLDLFRPTVEGGIAIHLYTIGDYPELLRPSHDLDLSSYVHVTARAFRELLGGNMAALLEEYNPQLSKLRRNYEVKIEDEDEDSFLIHTYRFSNNGFQRSRDYVQRKIENANNVQIPGTFFDVRVTRPEDILESKMDRISKTSVAKKDLGIYSKLYKLAQEREIDSLSIDELCAILEEIKHFKGQIPAYLERGKEDLNAALDEYCGMKDIYDIFLVGRLASESKLDFDEQYYDDVLALPSLNGRS
ncbi:hypothetical protein CL616_01095 [archaeon]|nr:hypothetical protein [archaeon]